MGRCVLNPSGPSTRKCQRLATGELGASKGFFILKEIEVIER